MSVINKLMTSAQTTLGDARVAATIGTSTTGLSVAQVMGVAPVKYWIHGGNCRCWADPGHHLGAGTQREEGQC